MPPEFEIRREITLPAPPEQVWQAVATSEGNAAWLFPNEIEAGEGAKNPDGSIIKAWDPPRHFHVRVDGENGWFNAVEHVIEARGGGTTVLRYAHSGIFVDDWDNQYDAANQHTDFYLHTLGEYLAHFAGRPVTYIGDVPGGIQGPEASARPGAFDTVRGALGLSATSAEGDRTRVEVPGTDPLDGVVDYVHPNFVGIRSDDALYRFFGRNAFGMPVGMSVHHFGEDVDAAALRQAWARWLERLYA